MQPKTKQDLLRLGYGGYAGWGEQEALADFYATGGAGKYDPLSPAVAAAGGITDPMAIARAQEWERQQLLQRQRQEEENLLQQFENLRRGQETLPAAYQRLTQEAGIPQLQEQIGFYRSQIANVKNLLDRLEEDINTRTRGALMNEAQRRRLIAAEATPLQTTLGRLGAGLEPLVANLQQALSGVGTQLSLLASQQERELEPIKTRIAAISDRFAREITGFTQDKQNQLNILLRKLEEEGALTRMQLQQAAELAQLERRYELEKELAQQKLTGGGGFDIASFLTNFLNRSQTQQQQQRSDISSLADQILSLPSPQQTSEQTRTPTTSQPLPNLEIFNRPLSGLRLGTLTPTYTLGGR